MLCLAHAPALDILRNGTSSIAFEAGLELALTHTGNARETGEGNIKGIVVGNITGDISESFNIFYGKRVGVFGCLLFLIVHNKSNRLGDICFVKEGRSRTFSAVVFDLKQQPGHGREVRRLIDALKRCRKIKIKLRVVRFQELLIVRGQNVNADGMDGDTLVVDKGQIVQRGTHEALMAQGGIYRRFITGREQAVGWKL